MISTYLPLAVELLIALISCISVYVALSIHYRRNEDKIDQLAKDVESSIVYVNEVEKRLTEKIKEETNDRKELQNALHDMSKTLMGLTVAMEGVKLQLMFTQEKIEELKQSIK